jgi:hypothetical protein
MQRVFVLSKTKKPLMPCKPSRAKRLLDSGKAKVYRLQPFTLILTERKDGDVQEIELKLDPGSKTTGIALVAHFKNQGYVVLWASNLEHRGHLVVLVALEKLLIENLVFSIELALKDGFLLPY